MVLVFDGSEGGAHNTWEYLHVVAAGQAAPRGVSAMADRLRERCSGSPRHGASAGRRRPPARHAGPGALEERPVAG